MRDRWDVVLGTHLHCVNLPGVRSYRIDLGDPKLLETQLEPLAPDLLVHTAAMTDVDRCESAPELATAVNAGLAGNVAKFAARAGVGLIHISTDHLFATDSGPYSESDPPCPLNEYGRSKLKGEELVQDACPQALVVRTNFFGWGHARRQSFSDWIIGSLRNGEAISLFDDVHFTPILADALAKAAHELAAAGRSGTYNLVGDDRVSKYEFGLRLAKRLALPLGPRTCHYPMLRHAVLCGEVWALWMIFSRP
jgi:dTDP-4-dehydrorhamnose reductase